MQQKIFSYKALVFDFDGIICNTEIAIYNAWKWVYASEGKCLRIDKYLLTVGLSAKQAIEQLIFDLNALVTLPIDWPSKLAEKDKLIAKEHVNLTVLPGIKKLLEQAKRAGIPCCIATSSTRDRLIEKLKKLCLLDYFTYLATGDDIKNSKPAPDVYLAAAKSIGVEPNFCLAFEDSSNGLKSALDAGCKCIAIPTALTETQDFSGALACVSSLEGIDLITLDRIWINNVKLSTVFKNNNEKTEPEQELESSFKSKYSIK